MTEADVGWYLRHRDGIEHGPFRLVDIVAAAKAGNVASDTSVRHEAHTKNQWVLAVRLQPIAQAMHKAAGGAASNRPVHPSSQPVSAQPANPQPGSSQPPIAQPSVPPQTVGRKSVFSEPPKPTEKAASIENDALIARDAEREASLTEVETTSEPRSAHIDPYPVPRRFVTAIQILFTDFGFRRFITPWIVKMLWVLHLSAAVASLLFFGYVTLIAPLMSTGVMPKGTGRWEFEMGGQDGTMFSGRLFAFLIYAFFVTIGVLLVRMIGELIIVFIRASGEVSEVRKLLKQQKASDP